LPSSKVPRRLQDIIDNAQAIFRYTEGMGLADFEENRLVSDAVERCLERICEAVVKLGEQARVLMPDQPWYKFRAFGNVLRHGYDTIEEDKLFDIVRNDLPSLYAAAASALQSFPESDPDDDQLRPRIHR
jgi:uncharacterized protein with HEPN domain